MSSLKKISLLKYESPRLILNESCRPKEILDELFPPLKTIDRHHHQYIQCVSRQPATEFDVKSLEKSLDEQLKSFGAMEIGLCPIRRQFYDQCFDELVRQVTIECAERGILLHRIRNFYRSLMTAFEKSYLSGNAYAMRTYLLNEQKRFQLTEQIDHFEFDLQQLRDELNTAEDHYEHVTNLYSRWKLSIEERDRTSSNVIPFELEQLRRTHEQLKEELEEILLEKLNRRLFEMIK